MTSDGPSGVGGWLLFFCLSMTVRPLILSYTVFCQFPHFESPGDPMLLILFFYWLSLSFIASNLFVAFLLWTSHRGAVIATKAYFGGYIVFCLAVTVIAFTLPADQYPRLSLFFNIFPKSLFAAAFYIAVWLPYVYRSLRVANTYGVESGLPNEAQGRGGYGKLS